MAALDKEDQLKQLPSPLSPLLTQLYYLPRREWRDTPHPLVQARLAIAVFEKQVRDGCGEPTCSKPPCRTYNERISRTPYRPLSALSVQATATMLASEPDAVNMLCSRIYRDHVMNKKPIDYLATSRIRRPNEPFDFSSFMQTLFSTNALQNFLNKPLDVQPIRANLEYPYRLEKPSHEATKVLAKCMESRDPECRKAAKDIIYLTSLEAFTEPTHLVASFRDSYRDIRGTIVTEIGEYKHEQMSRSRSEYEAQIHRWRSTTFHPLVHLEPFETFCAMQKWIEWNSNLVLDSIATGVAKLIDMLIDPQDFEDASQDLHDALGIPDDQALPSKAHMLAHAVVLAATALQIYISKSLEKQSTAPFGVLRYGPHPPHAVIPGIGTARVEGFLTAVSHLPSSDFSKTALDLVKTLLPVLVRNEGEVESCLLQRDAHDIVMSHFEQVESYGACAPGWAFWTKSDAFRDPGSFVEPLLIVLGILCHENYRRNSSVKKGSWLHKALRAYQTLANRAWQPYGQPLTGERHEKDGQSEVFTLSRHENRWFLHAPDFTPHMKDEDLVDIWVNQPKTELSLLEFPFLFASSHQSDNSRLAILAFRGISFNRMWRVVKTAQLNQRLIQSGFVNIQNRQNTTTVNELQNLLHQNPPHGLRDSIASGIEITVSRARLLDDAFDQLWKRNIRHLLLPLRVRMADVGEIGADMGGVAQEFFGMVAREMFDPAKALFKLQGPKQFAWFDPACREPAWRFQILGLIFALALHNGFTIPVNFPLYLYRLLINPETSFLTERVPACFVNRACEQRYLALRALGAIQDAWPDLTTSLDSLLDYDGNLEEDIGADACFTIDVHGAALSIPVIPRPASFSIAEALTTELPPAPPVSQHNVEEYISGYVHFLLHTSVDANLRAFLHGFHALTPPSLLSYLSPFALKLLAEGNNLPTPDQLRAVTRYEDYDPADAVIRHFWTEVATFTEDEMRRLLEFVTATDRLPVNGWETLEFKIQKHGGGDDVLISSSTCFGILFMPEYSSRAVLGERVRVALREGVGFGLR